MKDHDLHINRKVNHVFNGQELQNTLLAEYLLMLEYSSPIGLSSLEVAQRWGKLTQKYGWTSKYLKGKEQAFQPIDYFNARSYLFDYCEYVVLN